MRFRFSGVLCMALLTGALFVHSFGAAAAAETRAPDQAAAELSYLGPDGGLWLTQIGRGPLRLLLAQGEFADYFWSPDGNRVAYIASDGGLVVLEIVTGRRIRLSDASVDEAVWAPNSEQIIFSRSQHLWLASARGGSVTRLTDWTPDENDRLAQIMWTADGRYVVYQSSRGHGAREMSLLDVRARRTRTYQFASGAGGLEAAALSPDGRVIWIPHWHQGESADLACRAAGMSVSNAAPDTGGGLTQALEMVSLSNLDRKGLACWPLSQLDALTTGWVPPTFLRDGQIAVVPTLEAPSGLVAIERSGVFIEPRALGLVSTAEESGRLERRYPTEIVSSGAMAAVVYRQDETAPEGVWFSVELHLIDASGGSVPRRDVLIREGCYCPDDRADINVADLQFAPDGKRLAFTFFQNGVNRVAITTDNGQVAVLTDGERPLWRPRR